MFYYCQECKQYFHFYSVVINWDSIGDYHCPNDNAIVFETNLTNPDLPTDVISDLDNIEQSFQ